MHYLTTLFLFSISTIGFTQCPSDTSFFDFDYESYVETDQGQFIIDPELSYRQDYLADPKAFYDSIGVVELRTVLATACKSGLTGLKLVVSSPTDAQWELIELVKNKEKKNGRHLVERVRIYDAKSGDLLFIEKRRHIEASIRFNMD